MKANDIIMDQANDLKQRVGLGMSIEECIVLVSGMFEDAYTWGYKEGYDDATSEACKEINKNYTSNDKI